MALKILIETVHFGNYFCIGMHWQHSVNLQNPIFQCCLFSKDAVANFNSHLYKIGMRGGTETHLHMCGFIPWLAFNLHVTEEGSLCKLVAVIHLLKREKPRQFAFNAVEIKVHPGHNLIK